MLGLFTDTAELTSTPKSRSLLIIGVALSAIAAMVTGASPTVSPALGVAREYNGFFLEDFESASSRIEGRLAAGGDIHLNHFALGKALKPQPAGNSLVAGNDIHFPSGRIFNGSVLAGGSAAGIGSRVTNGLKNNQTITGHADLPFNFADEFYRLARLSLDLGSLQTNGTTRYQWNGLYLEGDCHSSRQIFRVHGSQLDQAHSLSISCVPTDATIVVNVSGGQTGLGNMGLQRLKPFGERTLFNFYEATHLVLGSVSINGSVLAPYAQIDANSGTLNGSVFARSWSGNMTLRHLPFTGSLPQQKPGDSSRPLWLAAGKSVGELVPAAGFVAPFDEVTGTIEHLAIDDYSNRVLAASSTAMHVWQLDQDFTVVGQDNIPLAGLADAELHLNTYTGELAYAVEGGMHIIDLSAGSQTSVSIPRIAAVTAGDENTRFYTATGSTVLGWEKQQEEASRLDVGYTVDHLGYDSQADLLWAQGEGKLTAFTAEGTPQTAVDVGAVTAMLATGDGGLWLQAGGQLAVVHNGNLQTIPHVSGIAHWALDKADNTLWVVLRTSILHIDQAGQILGRYPVPIQILDKGISGLGLYADIYPPTVEITYPESEAELDEASLASTFDYHDPGLGIDESGISLTLNGELLEAECDLADKSGECSIPNLEDGTHSIQLSLRDKGGNETSEAVSFTTDTSLPDPTPLSLTIESPTEGTYTKQNAITLMGYLNKAASVTVNDEAIATDNENHFQTLLSLVEGANSFAIVAIDAAGREVRQTVTVILDTASPGAPDGALVNTTLSGDGTAVVSGGAGSVEPQSQVIITNTRTGESVTATATSDGGFMAVIAAEVGDELRVAATDKAGNASGATQTTVSDLPPDPALVAPPLSESGVTPFNEAISFLYSGSNPIQTGVQADVIEARRVAVIRGQVFDKQNNPLPGVTVTIKDHPELGQTRSRSDGMFDLAVNGGGYLTINYQKEGYLPVQRKVNAPWRDYAFADDVVMIRLDSQVTTIDLSSPTMQVAQGTPQTDADGTRQATLLFPADTTATMTLPDGSTQALTTLNVRATEYTVGENGPETMPGKLPPASAYTYAVELSVDEALQAGATRVNFNQPVPLYVDNFIGFPTGETVPLGYYDRTKAAWIASESGRVIEILAIENGQAVLDPTGDGTPATQAQLDELAITEAELQQLATIYTAGKTLWRSPIPHFTPWDCNWPYGPPEDAEPPPEQPPETPEDDQLEDTEDENECEGCVISPQAQALEEEVPIVGTPFSLHYRSDRAVGRKNNTVTVPVTRASIPDSLSSISVTVDIAGRRLTRTPSPIGGLEETFEWDGLDAYGRPVYGTVEGTVTVTYYYPCMYRPGDNGFAQFGSSSETIGTRINCRRFAFPKQWTVFLQPPWQLPVNIVGNWSLSAYHSWDIVGASFLSGNGDRRSAPLSITSLMALQNTISTLAGTGENGWGDNIGDGGPAIEALLGSPNQLAMDAAGNLYVAEAFDARIRKISPDGTITTVAGTGERGFSGDGGPATEAKLYSPYDIAVDRTGNIYIADTDNNRIRRIGADGTITTVAGTGEYGYSGDGGPAKEAKLYRPSGVAADSFGNLYIVDQDLWNVPTQRIRRVSPSGIITTVAGGRNGTSADGALAIEAKFKRVTGVTTDAKGNLYIADYDRIRRIDTAGLITTVAGTGGGGGSFENGILATKASIYPYDVAVDRAGNLFMSGNGTVCHISSHGFITTIAGTGEFSTSGEDGIATEVALGSPMGLAVTPHGELYIADWNAYRIRQMDISSRYNAQPSLASRDGTRRFVFDSRGVHLRTINSLTGQAAYTFSRDKADRLIAITDIDGEVTTIERDSEGKATAIIAPDGRRTELRVDSNGHLAAVTNPSGETIAMSYTDGGLLTDFTNRKGQVNRFKYNELGRLIQDINPAGGGWTLERTELESGYQTTMTTAEQLRSTFTVEPQPAGGRIQRNTRPDGSVQEKRFSNGGDETTIQPDGTVITVQEGPDPRFGMQSPVQDATVTTPAGLVSTTDRERTAVLADTADLVNLETLTETTTINGRTFEIRYQAAARTFTSTSPEGRVSTRTINEAGRPIQIQAAGLAPNILAYDERGRLSETAVGEGTTARTSTFSYDALGNLESVTDPLSRVVSYNYDLAGRVTKQTFPDGRSVDYQYDANGNLTAITPPGREAHVFSYTSVDLEEDYTPPDIEGAQTITRYQYNRDKKLTAIERPDGRTVAFDYDFGGRLAEIAIERGTYAYAYNPTTGQRSQVTAPDGGTTSYTYDGFLPLSQTWSGEINGSVTRSYNNNFWLTERCINETDCVSFAYDNDGLLVQAGSLTTNRHAQHGLITATTLGTVQTQRSYNSFGEMLSHSAAMGDRALADFGYARDSIGRINQKTETVNGSLITEGYSYDQSGRLISATRNGVITIWGYDANGNRTHENGNEVATYDSQDRLLTYGAASYSYTANGELISKTENGATTNCVYDELGNLISVALPGDITLSTW